MKFNPEDSTFTVSLDVHQYSEACLGLKRRQAWLTEMQAKFIRLDAPEMAESMEKELAVVFSALVAFDWNTES